MAIPPTQLQTPAEFSGNVLFYSKPEPLSRELHGKIGLRRMDRPFGFAAQTNVVPLTVGEFPIAGLSYPIIFAGERYQPLAVQTGAYIPAYIRRYPFVLANDPSREQLVVCIDRAASMLGEDYDLPFFNENGEPTDYTNGCIQFCNDFENEGRRTESFIALLKELDLFETARASFAPNNPDGTAGTPQPIAEYFAVSETKLKALPPEKLLELIANGAVAQIYAHLMSLTGWDRLIALTMERQAQTAPANMN
jgi:hypothetical protein